MTSIVLLTAPSCRQCDHAKNVLLQVSRDHPLTVETVSIASDRGQSLAIEHRVAFPPAVLLDGQSFSYGRLSERRLRRELDRRARTAFPGSGRSTNEAGSSGVSL